MLLSPQNRPTRQCHAVTLAETPTGLVAAWFGERKASWQGSGIWVMRQVAGCWTPPEEVIGSTCHSEDPLPCWNPVLFQPHAGPLQLFYKVGLSPRTWRSWCARSEDHGRTWSPPHPLGFGRRGAQRRPLTGPAKNKPIQLPDATVLCPSSSERRGRLVHIELSRDLEDWEIIGPIEDPLGLGAIQPCLLPMRDGHILALCRTRQRVIARSLSMDGGQTWSPLAPTSLPNPDSGIDAVALDDGRLLLVYNDSAQHRTPLVAAISDDGEHWQNVLTLESESGEFSYPAAIKCTDGKVHIAYTWRRQGFGYTAIEPGLIPKLSLD